MKTDMTTELDFLREQMNEVDHKITRLDNALSSCDDCLESESLERMQRNAGMEREILNELWAHQQNGSGLSLDAAIMEHTRLLKREAERLVSNWHKGHPTPPAYWETEIKQAFLADLLRRVHAWQEGRPYYSDPRGASAAQGVPGSKAPVEAAPVYNHPWYLPPSAAADEPHQAKAADEEDPLKAFEARIVATLDSAHLLANHLEITVQPGGTVLITGYAHSEEEREGIILLLMEMDGVWELLTDIQVIDPAHCPICHPPDNGKVR